MNKKMKLQEMKQMTSLSYQFIAISDHYLEQTRLDSLYYSKRKLEAEILINICWFQVGIGTAW